MADKEDVGAAGRIWRWCGSNRALVAAGVLAGISAIAAIVILSVAVVLVSKSRHEAAEQRQRAEEQLLRSEGLLYASQIASALREWETNNVASAWSHLNSCREDLRGWEFDYLYTLFNKNQETFKGHKGWVTSVAFSPDGKRIASASSDGTLKVWDATTGEETLKPKGHKGWVLSVAFSPDGKRIACGSDDRTVKLWDATTGQETLTLDGPYRPRV